MKDLFGNTKPVQIEDGEWWFNGRIIQKQNDSRLPVWISFADNDNSNLITAHQTGNDAIIYSFENPCREPRCTPKDYIGGLSH